VVSGNPEDVIMFVYNDGGSDSRVWREARTLREAGYRVTIIAVGLIGSSRSEVRHDATLTRIPVAGVLPGEREQFAEVHGRGVRGRMHWLVSYCFTFVRWTRAAVREALRVAEGATNVYWHGHDLTGLIPAVRARAVRDGALIYDSHELFMEAGAVARLPPIVRKILSAYEGSLARRVDEVVTVNASIAEELARRYSVPTPHVIMNCAPLGPRPPERLASPLRQKLNLGSRPVLLHHGNIADGRGALETVAALDHLPPESALVILGNGKLVPTLEELSRTSYSGRLFLHPAVPWDDLPRWVAAADVGVIAFAPIDRNNYYGTPNKLFDYLAAGVPVVTSDFPEMRRIVRTEGVGETCDPLAPTSIAASVRSLLERSSDEREAMRTRCRQAAERRYSWEHEALKLLDVYAGLSSIQGSARSRHAARQK
jgi:glycosyltransferase involved in cell wall biosynthesis